MPAAPPLQELAEIVGAAQLLTDPEVVGGFCVDFTGRFLGTAVGVVRPSSTAEVAAIVAWCRANEVAMVPQGGNTGLVGGATPRGGELVVSLTRLTQAPQVATDAGTLQAGAGVTVADVHAAAQRSAWAYGVDFAARASATIGGSVATNAGGLHHVRYGDTRRQLAGVEAVLGTGDVVSHLTGLDKDNTGYHLSGLLCGSEGTLGVVTAVTVRLVPPAPQRTAALIGFVDLPAAVAAATQLRRGLAELAALELVLAPGVHLVCETFSLPLPLDPLPEVMVLVETAGTENTTESLAAAADALSGVAGVAVAEDAPGRERLWRYRELHTEAINMRGVPHKLDVTLPADSLVPFTDELPAKIARAASGTALWLFGHLGDGNLHVNITGAAPDDEAVDDAVLQLVARHGGSISAEHGIGRAKRRWLHLNRSDAELRAFRAVASALDPDGICNPGVLLP